MEQFLRENRGNLFMFRAYDDDGIPATGLTVQIRLLRMSSGTTYQWDGSNWVAWDGTEQWKNMSEALPGGGATDTSGLYSYYLPANGIGAWYNQTIVAEYREATTPLYHSDTFQIVESFVQTTPEDVVDAYTYVDQDGWYSDEGVRTDWGDEMEGYLYDPDTGERVVGAHISAFAKVLGDTIETNMPPFQTLSGWDGNWNGWIHTGTYEFFFYKDHLINESVVRTVG